MSFTPYPYEHECAADFSVRCHPTMHFIRPRTEAGALWAEQHWCSLGCIVFEDFDGPAVALPAALTPGLTAQAAHAGLSFCLEFGSIH